MEKEGLKTFLFSISMPDEESSKSFYALFTIWIAKKIYHKNNGPGVKPSQNTTLNTIPENHKAPFYHDE